MGSNMDGLELALVDFICGLDNVLTTSSAATLRALWDRYVMDSSTIQVSCFQSMQNANHFEYFVAK